ncbi:MAG: hypothetical protein J6V43_03550, partial [Rikenellaceae bacterium]|nr:hypothetical protein [Rikenellaceae bacterium]
MNIKHLALLASAAMFAACGGRNHTAHEHDHSAHTHEVHSHADHDHEEHSHEAHEEHNHEAHEACSHDHSHESHEGHSHAEHADHEGHESHDHSHEGHDHSEHADGEIVFSAEQAEAAGVQTEVLVAGDFAEVIRTSGVVESAPASRSAVVAPASGVVKFQNIYVGSRVRKGQV